MALGGATLHIDLDAIVANWRAIGAAVRPATAGAVIKADAYGLGARPVSDALAAAGCRSFFVAMLCEALPLARSLSDQATIYVLNGLLPGEEAECAAAGVVPVLNSIDQLDRWADLARTQRRRLPAILQVDSGMARLGLSPDEVASLAASSKGLDGLDLHFVISHFACADEPTHPANAAQRDRFERLAAMFPNVPRCLDNSGGALASSARHFDLARAGLALYGGAPIAERPSPMRPVVRLAAPIIQLRRLRTGGGVGYGLTFTARRETLLATIPVGYADGWPRHLSGRGCAYIGPHRVPIAGRISMDSLTLDVTDVPSDLLGPGASVELIGAHQTIEDVARDAGTISYEILTRLGSRYARVYNGAQTVPACLE